MNEMTKGNIDYRKPQIKEVEMCIEGVLCASTTDGSTNGLKKESTGDIWF